MSLGEDRNVLYERRLREQQPKQQHFVGQDAIRRLNDAIKPIQEHPNQNPLTYCLDFDGVLHYHESGSGAGALTEPLSPGIRLAKRIKAAGHKLVILTARPEEQHETIHGWLKGHGVKADEVTNKKPPAEMYIDDRAERWPRNAGTKHQVSEGGPGSGPRGKSYHKSDEGINKSSQKTIAVAKANGWKHKPKEMVAGIHDLQKKDSNGRTHSFRISNLGEYSHSIIDNKGVYHPVEGYVGGSSHIDARDYISKNSDLKALSDLKPWKSSKESKIDSFGENGGDGSMNMLDGHHYKSLATHESKKKRRNR